MSTLIGNLSTLCGLCILLDGAYGPRVNPLPPSTSHILLKTYAPNHSHRSSPSFELWLGPLLQGRLKELATPHLRTNTVLKVKPGLRLEILKKRSLYAYFI